MFCALFYFLLILFFVVVVVVVYVVVLFMLCVLFYFLLILFLCCCCCCCCFVLFMLCVLFYFLLIVLLCCCCCFVSNSCNNAAATREPVFNVNKFHTLKGYKKKSIISVSFACIPLRRRCVPLSPDSSVIDRWSLSVYRADRHKKHAGDSSWCRSALGRSPPMFQLTGRQRGQTHR